MLFTPSFISFYHSFEQQIECDTLYFPQHIEHGHAHIAAIAIVIILHTQPLL